MEAFDFLKDFAIIIAADGVVTLLFRWFMMSAVDIKGIVAPAYRNRNYEY